ncbi:extracellular solute-binding protein [Salaquimonas pukyongi]|uniref:extracellular solute-binding protein n=1 Tax=Salaquimonas pukyongi TaxID=2712698 RepID=UPI00096B7F3A|nr:extracellular solute-binding protein [Salaquimonas pukyongi]
MKRAARLLTVSFAALVAVALAMACTALAQDTSEESAWKHGDTLFGDLKYPAGFPHYDHVNPKAAKGGRFNQASTGGFDSFNPFVVRGRAAPGLSYTGGILWDSLFEQSVDQPSASYGLVAEAFRFPPDYSSATYRLNPKARWHDGEPITPEDVIWSLEKLKAVQPLYANYYRNVISAEKTGDREVTFRFDIKGNRELPHIMGDLPVLPKHWWTANGPDGKPRDISQPLDEIPLGSGPYRVKEMKVGESITWERVKDYWAADLGVRKGRFNFDEIRYVNFSDQTAAWEAFKKGGIEDLWAENRSQRWAEEYIFPAFKKGDVLRKAFPTEGPEAHQALYFNTRRDQFADKRVREALTLLYDFETMNRTLFFDLYTRTDSYFEGGELQSEGLPEGRELQILEEYRGRIEARIFVEPFTLPVIKSPSDTRKMQRAALKLFRQAGYNISGGTLVDGNGNPFTIEFLGRSPVDERIVLPYIEKLRPLGITASLRIVDAAQYKNRVDNYDFDMVTNVTLQSLSPGNEQREYWTSGIVDKPGGRNLAGISDPVIDELVERIIVAENREELVALTKALDRLLKFGFYSIPQWHNPDQWYAWWRKLQIPENQPLYSGLDIWSVWIDTAIERELEQ